MASGFALKMKKMMIKEVAIGGVGRWVVCRERVVGDGGSWGFGGRLIVLLRVVGGWLLNNQFNQKLK